MTRVAFLTPSLHCGGAERWILSLAKHFSTARAVGCLLLGDHYHPAMLAEAQRLMPVVSSRHAYEARELLESMSRDADVLVSWGIPGLSHLRHDLRVPLVEVSHASGVWPAQRKLATAACQGADYLAAVSRTAAAAYPPAMRGAVRVIYNGVEADRVAPRMGREAMRRRLGIESSRKILLFLGRFCEEKRPALMFDALQQLPREWHALFVGHGPLESSLQAQALNDVPGRCRFLAPTSHVGDLLAAADCLLLPSRYEGMPLVLLEAWLAGLPTVASRFEFLAEIEQLHGPLCEAVSLEEPRGEELAAAIERASTRRLVDDAQRIVWQRYTAGAMAQRWEEYLAAVVEHHRMRNAA